MGNRGTTPSWDEEEIAKWGFDAHFSSIRWHLDFPQRQLKSKSEELLNLLSKFLVAKKENDDSPPKG